MIKFQSSFLKFIKNKHVHAVLWLLLLVVVWELTAWAGLVPNYFLPRFSTVVSRFFTDMIIGSLFVHIKNSLGLIMLGFFVSYLLTVAMIILSIKSKILGSFFSTLTTIMNPLPSMALMPLFILWFGIGQTVIIVMMVHGILWSTYRYLYDGWNNIPKVYEEFSRNIELGIMQKTRHVIFHALMPQIIASLRVGWGRAWRALISAEIVFGIIGQAGGIGYYISMGRAYSDMVKVMVGVLVIMIIGILVESVLFVFITNKTVKKWGGGIND